MSHKLTIGVVCSVGVGAVRGGRAVNEDNYLICRDGEIRFRDGEGEVVKKLGQAGAAGGPDRPPASDTDGTLLAVADGMGGHDDGALASSAAVQGFARLYEKGRPDAPELALHRFVLSAHRRIREMVSQRGPVAMGTTITGAWILDDRMFWIHVGDSRLYHQRGTVLTCLTRDHTRGEFARRDRRAPPRDPDLLAQNFVYGSRGLGDDAAIRIDPGRDSGSVRLAAGDRIVLCTDGLTRFVDEYRMAYALRDVPSPAACAEVLLERAIALGSTDNVTVIVARVDEVTSTCHGDEIAEGEGHDDTIVPV